MPKRIHDDFLRKGLLRVVVGLLGKGGRAAVETNADGCERPYVQGLQPRAPNEQVVDDGDGVDGGCEGARLDDVGVAASGGREPGEHARAEQLEEDDADDGGAEDDGARTNGLEAERGIDL